MGLTDAQQVVVREHGNTAVFSCRVRICDLRPASFADPGLELRQRALHVTRLFILSVSIPSFTPT